MKNKWYQNWRVWCVSFFALVFILGLAYYYRVYSVKETVDSSYVHFDLVNEAGRDLGRGFGVLKEDVYSAEIDCNEKCVNDYGRTSCLCGICYQDHYEKGEIEYNSTLKKFVCVCKGELSRTSWLQDKEDEKSYSVLSPSESEYTKERYCCDDAVCWEG